MIKELFLQKGWAGKTISRAETVDLLNPIIKRHLVLNNEYGYVVNNHADSDVRALLAESQKVARANVGKLAETVYSCGGVAYTGVDMEPAAVDLGSDSTKMIETLLRGERELIEIVGAESKVEHQMRTRAILGVVADSAEQRVAMLEEVARGSR